MGMKVDGHSAEQEGDDEQGPDKDDAVDRPFLDQGEGVLAPLHLGFGGLLLLAVCPLPVPFIGCHDPEATGSYRAVVGPARAMEYGAMSP